MSYILEALKKAQAERQLGSAPTIHALPIQAAAAERTGAGRAPLAIALTAAVVAAIAAGVLWWRQATPVAPPLASAVVEPRVGPAQLPPGPVVVARQLPVAPPAPVAVAVPPPPSPAKNRAPASASAPGSAPVSGPASAPVSAPVSAPPASASVSAPAAQAAEPVVAAQEENLPMLRELPEAQRAGMPQVTFGGYMYSPNPADRLLLIDKTLRREGEEVAPGLVLERLLPKAAVMNYRGMRYRVPY